jgi:hypothetical protein
MSQYDQFIRQQKLQKKKDAQQRQADTQTLHKYNQAVVTASLYKGADGEADFNSKSSAYDAAKAKEAERAKLGLLKEQMAEQEAKWKEEYNALMEENAKLKKQGEDALQATQWQERYEAAMKEKDEAMANIEKEKEKLLELQQMKAAKLKEREQLSSQLLVKAASAAQKEKEMYEAALKEKDQAMVALQKERDSISSQLHDADKAEMVVDQEGPCCADDFIDEEEEHPSSMLSDQKNGTHCADDYVDSEDVDEEAGITKEAENNVATFVGKEDQIDDKEAKPNRQNKDRRCYIIIGVLSCLVIVAVAIAVPIAVVRANPKSEKDSYIPRSKSICGRSIPIDLTDTSTWPTPSTPTLFQADYDMNAITLVKNDAPYGSIGMQLNAFFRAFDYSHDTRLPLYISQDNYFFLTGFFKLFMGGFKKDAAFWEMLEGILGAKIVENEAALTRQGKFAADYKGPEELNAYVGDELVANQIRNHRDTILRRLFKYPTLTGGDDDVCSLIQSEGSSKKYTVVHLSDEKTNSLLSELNKSTGLDHSAAVEMSPEYVKAFLAPLKMFNSDIYPIATGEYETLDTSVAKRVQALLNDYVLGDLIRLPKESRHLGSVLYFAVLADVYLGNPVDHNSMWIARMRCALGLCSNTFILTKKTLVDCKVKWVSYVNENNYLELYDREKLGLWSG